MKTKIDPDAIYVAIESFAGDHVTVPRGMRLRGNNPIVKRAPWAFLKDGYGEEEAVARRIANLQAAEPVTLPDPLQTVLRPTIRLEDRRICIKGCGVAGWTSMSVTTINGEAVGARPGDVLSRRMRVVKENPDCFVALGPKEVLEHPEDALVATDDLRLLAEDGRERLIRRGEWVHRDDPAVRVLGAHFVRPPLD